MQYSIHSTYPITHPVDTIFYPLHISYHPSSRCHILSSPHNIHNFYVDLAILCRVYVDLAILCGVYVDLAILCRVYVDLAILCRVYVDLAILCLVYPDMTWHGKFLSFSMLTWMGYFEVWHTFILICCVCRVYVDLDILCRVYVD